jgi:ABC-type multidrug transport system fused ATPase/permease subunit
MAHQVSTPPSGFREYLKEMKESASVLRWIWDELVNASGKRYLSRMLVAMVLSVAFFAAQPLIFAQIINHVRDTRAALLGAFVGGFAIMVLLKTIAQYFQEVLREKAWNRTIYSMQERINELFYEKPLGQHSEEGTTLNYTTIDRGKNRVETIQQLLLFDAGAMIIQIIVSYILMWFVSWWVGLMATVLVLVHVTWSLYLNYHISVKTELIERDMRAQNRQVHERWEKIIRVKTSGKSTSEHKRLFTWLDEILVRDQTFWCWYIKQAKIRDGVGHGVRVLVIGLGAYFVYRHMWQIGTLVPLYSWMTDLSSNLGWVGNAERRINQQVPYIKAMRNALMSPAAFTDDDGIEMHHKQPISVTFKDVGLAYKEGDSLSDPVLQCISFTVHPGEKIGIIGASGSGKSSLMKLVLRYMDPTSGEIWVNGSRLTEVRRSSWMERIGYIPQREQVFDGTIRYNLTFGLSEERQASITDEEIWKVMRLLQIDFGKRLTHGLDTLVGKDGMKLSGGQSQRLMMGAAVIKDPIFMVIDEATSSLDSITEERVQEGLETILGEPIGAIIIAHRLASIRRLCTRFLVLRPLEDVPPGESQIEAEAPSFEELYVCSPIFRQLADAQSLTI